MMIFLEDLILLLSAILFLLLDDFFFDQWISFTLDFIFKVVENFS